MNVKLDINIMPEHSNHTEVKATFENGKTATVWVDEKDEKFPLLNWIKENQPK